MPPTCAGIFTTLGAALTLAAAGSVVAPRDAWSQDPAARDTARADTARADTAQMYVLRTRDGSLLVGRLIGEDADSVRFLTSGGPIALPRSAVLELRRLGRGAIRDGVYWPANPNDSRLFFAPTGRMLEKGEGYFSDTYLFFLSFVGGVSSRLTLGAGFSILPTTDFTNNVFYLTPKVGLVATPNVNVAAGALIGFVGLDFVDETEGSGDNGTSFGIVYGVGTVGSPDGSVTFGAGYAYTGADVADRPLLMLGGEKRIARRASLLTENYVIPGENNAVASYGIRFFGDRLSVDLAFWNLIGSDVDTVFPGIPYVAFAVKF
jgi:hypothetical protein